MLTNIECKILSLLMPLLTACVPIIRPDSRPPVIGESEQTDERELEERSLPLPASESPGLWWSPRCSYPGAPVEAPAIHGATHQAVAIPSYLRTVKDWLMRPAMVDSLERLGRAHGRPAKFPQYELRLRPDGVVDRVVITDCSGRTGFDAAIGSLLLQQQLPERPDSAEPLYVVLSVRELDDVDLSAFELVWVDEP